MATAKQDAIWSVKVILIGFLLLIVAANLIELLP